MRAIALAFSLLLSASGAFAQTHYPEQSVRVLVGFPAGTAPDVGARIVAEICRQCWADWGKQQTMLINHYGLDVMDPQARTFLTRNMSAFLFKTGEGADIDTSKQGTISH